MTFRFKNRKLKRIASVLLSFFIFQFSVNAQIIADLIITNANVRTMNAKNPRADTIVVSGGKIIAVGEKRKMSLTFGNNTDVINAQGKLVLPGFNDAHVHFTAIGKQFFSIDLKNVKTPPEMVEKIKYYAQFLPKGAWILGGAWNNANWTPNDLPTKDLIDAATPDNPVFLYHADTKSVLVNSLALKSAQIAKTTKDIANGAIVRDENGEPNGILKDSAINLVKRFVPQFATEDKLAVAETASNYAAFYGVTSVQDVSADDNAETYRELLRQGKLKTRVYDCVALSDWQKLAKKDLKKSADDLAVRQGCLKGIADGDADSTAQLYDEIRAADRAGLQVMVHAIGASANEQILTVFERVVKINGKKDRRLRIEHAHGLRPQDFRRFTDSGIIASIQPFLFSNRAGKSFEPLRTFLENKTMLAFGSDSSMIPINPLFGIAAAVATNDPKQKLSVEEAVRFYTAGAAFAEFQENAKGTIAVGKLADFVILSDDIFTINPSAIRNVKVLETIVGGKIVYQNKQY